MEEPERLTWIIKAVQLGLIHIYIYIFFFFLFSDLGFRCLVVEVGQVAVGCMPILSLQGSLLVTLENEVVSRRYLLCSR